MRYSHDKIKTNKKPRGILVFGAFLALAIVGSGAYLINQTKHAKDTSSKTAKPLSDQTPAPVTKPKVEDTLELNQFEGKIINELTAFSDWLDVNDVKGYIGEVGWPDDPGWNTLGDKWLKVAEDRNLWASGWAAGSHWGNYNLLIYGSDGSGVLNGAKPQADVWKPFFKNEQFGVNLAGLEFGTNENFNSSNRGGLGVNYFAEPAESIAFLADQGVKMIRLPVRWERIQPVLYGPLDEPYSNEVSALLKACESYGIDVILDLHNYGKYFESSGMLAFSDGTLNEGHLIDVWQKMDQQFGQNQSILAYGLMNEPKDEPPQQEGARIWENVSQKTLTVLRDSGIENTIIIAGYNWSKVSTWSEYHPTGWIQDPLNNFRYEAHHYWDADSSGTYQQAYDAQSAE